VISGRMIHVHLPSPVLRSKIFKKFDEPRTTDVILLGDVSSYYPLRQRWDKVLKSRFEHGLQDVKVAKKQHPGPFHKLTNERHCK
jgi:hypothetical protein